MRAAVQQSGSAVREAPGRLLHLDPVRGTLADVRIDSLPELLDNWRAFGARTTARFSRA